MTASADLARQETELLIHAYMDGELDPVNALAVKQQIDADPALASELAAVSELQRVLRERLPRDSVPAHLRSQINAAVGLTPRWAQPTWRALAASVALVAVISSSSTWLLLGSQRARTTEDAIVADHIRALMAPQPADVASTDQHTVKPWFNGRVPEAPRVVDLASAGFPLIGGRIDVVSRSPVPTLVYRHRKHFISLTAVPAAGAANAAPALSTNDGYNIVRWVADGVTYWAISDVAAADLNEFAKLFRTTPP